MGTFEPIPTRTFPAQMWRDGALCRLWTHEPTLGLDVAMQLHWSNKHQSTVIVGTTEIEDEGVHPVGRAFVQSGPM